ncbi:MAG: transglycosylase domain-containing protein, partial [Anaerolineales bacterium]
MAAKPHSDDSDDEPRPDDAERLRRLTDPQEPAPPPADDPHRTVPWSPEPDSGPDPPDDDPYATQTWRPRSEATDPEPATTSIGSGDAPLPRPVPQRDPARTQVQPRVAYPEATRAAAPRRGRAGKRKRGWRYTLRRIYRFAATTAAVLTFLGIVVGVFALTLGIYEYFRIAATLPDVAELRDRAADFESTFIYDRDGNLLYEVNDPQAGRRTYVPLDQISPYVIAATLATEDHDYWNNLGFDPVAIGRALWQNYREGEIVSGASTITQQLARALLLEPEERAQQTNERKLREIILAAQMRAEYEPDEILELYLNEIYYGNLAYGIEAAAQTYFEKRASELNFAEAAFLAGLPQSPANYDVYQDPKLTFTRQ